MPVLLVVSNAHLALRLITCLRAVGRMAFVRDFTANPVLSLSRSCRGYRNGDLALLNAPAEEAAAWLNEQYREQPYSVALAAGMDATRFLARARDLVEKERLFPLSDESTLIALNDKWQFAALCRTLDLPHPETALLQAETDPLPDWYDDGPVVLKPVAGSGGRGVRVAPSRAELVEQVRQEARQRGLPCLLQRYIPGGDAVLGMLADQGKVRASTFFLYEGHGGAARFLHRPDVVQMGARIVEAQRFTGILEFDLRLDEREDRFYLSECNPRFWSSVTASLFVGINFVSLGMQSAGAEVAPLQEEYIWPGVLVRRLLHRQITPRSISSATWRGLRSTLSDPLPELFAGKMIDRKGMH